jgi:putative FmdB family regulatory protein
MPIYEYQCQSCEHEFEALQKMSDPLLTECPACHDQGLRKKISAAAFRLKGGGWYETDFKTGKKKNVAGEKSGDAGGGGDKAKESKGESKAGSSSPASAT